ncbi:MAG: flagellar biosynthesis anti-sigma factor FlgM [bacterium]
MLNDINSNINNNLGSLGANLLNNSQNINVSNVNNAMKNAYIADAKKNDLIDQGQISDEAIKKYETEKEIAYYKNILVQMLGTEEPKSDNVSALMKQLQSGNYNIKNSDLADSMLSDEDLFNSLFKI